MASNRAGDVGRAHRRAKDPIFRKTTGDERSEGAVGAFLGGREFVGRHRANAGLGGVEAAALHLGGEGLADFLADLAGGDAEIMDALHGLAVGPEKLVVHRDQLQTGRLRLVDDRGPQFCIRSANDEALCAPGGERVDGRECFFAVVASGLYEREPEILRGLFGELPFQLKPRLLRLLDVKADLDRTLGGSRAAGSFRRFAAPRAQHQQNEQGEADGGAEKSSDENWIHGMNVVNPEQARRAEWQQ
jgi:hypothetical protein